MISPAGRRRDARDRSLRRPVRAIAPAVTSVHSHAPDGEITRRGARCRDAARRRHRHARALVAGLATPPADTSHEPPVEQLICAQHGLGDATQAAIAKHLGPDRAVAIRGDSWPRLRELARCPDPQ